MLTTNTLKRKIRAGDEVYGLFCATPEPAMVEMIGCAGYDFVIIDTEHTLVGPQQVENMIRAAEAVGLTPLVRVAEGDTAGILRVLDGGAMGVVVAHVRSRSDVDAAVRAAKYAPEGMRSLNGGRVPGFGSLDLADYVRRANDEIMVVAMIEDAEGVDDIAPVLDGGGIDLVLEGAADLSQSYGVPWQTRHERVRDAVREVHGACAERGVPFCAIPRERDDHEEWLTAGVRTFVLGEERGIAARALREHLDEARRRG
ncbi:4-hydroxy-2-oxoheptanedioate aldolase [Prauserella isguenensis]|uniref:4-hydroxy-2-oxoheptanedioate aldolase n=1 Tax=Prauserella isguenensis TaxID=1470180 RepID=A0A839RZ91_9PSEU|nr:aldolase/citrate lyase family protein [Prauserella isguenensis]MBB3050482.1 4-hydroxy-2-oxoheptanedioate aldolase [Prauserella isguenensis]